MFKKKFFWCVVVILSLSAFIYTSLTHERFGAKPTGERLKRIEKTATYKNGAFTNTLPDPTNLEKENFFIRMYKIHFDKDGERVPSKPIPTVKTLLKDLDITKDTIIPLGHSSYYMHLNGLRILIDPVFTPYAAPFSILNKAFEGTSVYSVSDLPEIDYVLITHDHYDHLDYDTMKALRHTVPTVIAPLGVGAHLEHWGYAPEQIKEGYWYEGFRLNNDVEVFIVPARHYSSRLFDKNKTLWAGFALKSPKHNIYFSGDTGYGDHFTEISEKYGPFDVVMLDVGQYNSKGWPHIHMLPHEAATAAVELGAKRMLPGHNGKFAIALHDWKEPFELITAASVDKPYVLLTPMIGEIITIADSTQSFSAWWKDL